MFSANNRLDHFSQVDALGNRKACLALFALSFALLLSGCSSSSSSSTSTTNTVTLSPSTAQTLDEGESLTVTATVSNDSSNAGVTWTASGGGTLSNVTTTSVTYTAPTDLLTNTEVSLTATSIANSAYSASLVISIVSGLTITTTSLVAGNQNSRYFATLGASGGVTPLTWSIISGSLPVGLTLGTSTTDTNTIQGTPAAQGTSSFTVQVTDTDGNTATKALTLSIDPPLALAITTTSLPGGTVGTGYSQTLGAQNGTAPYTWSLLSGSNLPAGLTLSSAGTISGVPTTPGTFSFTVQVTDSSSPTQSASANLAITINSGVQSGSGLNGIYVFSLTGFDGSGRFATAGTITADGNGNISGGTFDFIDPAGPSSPGAALGPSTYSITSGSSLGTMTIAFPSPYGTRTFAFSIMLNGNANLIEFDGIAQGSGTLVKQTATAFSSGTILGSYAFGFIGADSSGVRFGMAGRFTSDGVSALSNGILDSDDAGVTANPAFAGTYTVANTGRGTAALVVPGLGTLNFAFYIVSGSQFSAVETDSVAAGSPLLSGSILQQSNVAFGGSSLNGYTICQVSALSSSNAEAQVGQAFWGTPDVSLTSDQNIAGTLTEQLSQSGTYVVNVNGRVTLANSGSPGSLLLPAGGASAPVIYLVQPNQGFVIGTDAAVTFGALVPQAVGPFTPASITGTYAGGTGAPVASSIVNEEVDAATGDGAGNLTIVYDQADGLIQNQSLVDTYTIQQNGRAVLNSNGSMAAILYVVSGSPGAFVELSTGADAIVWTYQH